MNKNVTTIMSSEVDQLEKLKHIVEHAIKEEKLIVDHLLHKPKEILGRGDSLSDKVASFGGSWTFIILFSVILTVWILFNSMLRESLAFDPYPFILMNLVLSAIAALQAPIIMMSQNRKEEKDRKQSENDYLINLKSELELRSLHQKIDLLMEEQIKVLFDSQAKQLELLTLIEKRLSK